MKNVLKKPIAALALGFLSLGAACSWGRFDDATDSPAIVILHASNATGDVIDIRQSEGQTPVLLSLVPRTATFYTWQIGDPENPNEDGGMTTYEGTKSGAGVATLNAGSVAYVGTLDKVASGGVPGECWVHGFRARPVSAENASGFAVTCVSTASGARESILTTIPSDIDRSQRLGPTFETQHDRDAIWRTVAGPLAEGPADKYLFPNLATFSAWDGGHFLVGTPDVDRVFVYPSIAPGAAFDVPDKAWGNALPITLDPGTDGAETRSFGAAITSVPASPTAPTSLGAAVAEPVSGKIFLYDIDPTARSATRRGCINGSPLSGLVLHGYLDGAKRVLAASNAAGTVVLYDFDAITSEACAPATPLATLTCAETGDVTGCADGAFGFSLRHADLDGDGDQELLVGAPGMNAREKVNAGAVYVYDLEAFSPAASDVLFVGNPKNGALLGSSLTTLRAGTRDLPVASAPGNRDVLVFYCGALSKASPRCQ